MSFGFGMGDVIAVSKLADKLRKRFVDSPDQFKAVSNEVKSLSNVLRDLEDVLPERTLTDRQMSDLQGHTKGCNEVLEDLNKLVDKYQELDVRPGLLSSKSRRLWKRLKWEPDDVKDLRSRLTSNLALLSAFNGSLLIGMSHATNIGVDRLNKHQDDQELQAILNWLSSKDFQAKQSDVFNRCQEDTGQWLLNSSEYQSWISGAEPILFCPGIPGAGKTMIASIVIHNLQERFPEKDVGVAYFYCNYKQHAEQTLVNLMTGLLKQLVQKHSPLPDEAKSLYVRHDSGRTRPSIQEISNAILSVAGSLSRVYVIIDALDECTRTERTRSRLLNELFILQAQTNISLLVTSRFIPEIEAEFKGKMFLKIRASDEDVKKYLETHMKDLPACISRDPSLQDDIKTEIAKAADGMFLLARLHLASLADKTKHRAVRLALKRLPKGSEALDVAYKEAVERIEGQESGFKQLAKQVLSWITYAQRQLTLLELQHALAIEDTDSEFHEEDLQEADEMISVCAGLVIVDKETGIIRLVHYTMHEYFERVLPSWVPDAQTTIAKTCLTYLSFDVFSAWSPHSLRETAPLLANTPLLDYAVNHWGTHAEMASKDVIDEPVLHFLRDNTKVHFCIQVLMEFRHEYVFDESDQATEMHLTAYLGLDRILSLLLEKGMLPDPRNKIGQTPLSYAAGRGHAKTVKLLLERSDVEADSKDEDGRTPLWYAADHGDESVMKLLLERSDVETNAKDLNGRTPLSKAARYGNEAAVRLLLERSDVGADSQDDYGRTPLSHAADNCEAIVKLLLERSDVEADSKDNNGRTPLSYAADNGHEAVVKLLLERSDVEADSKDEDGRTPLSYAANNGHEAVVKLLLERSDVEADSKAVYGMTPLSYAALQGHEAVVRVLIERPDVEINTGDEHGGTPLSRAASEGHEGVVRLLIEQMGVEMNVKDKLGRALSWAASGGYEGVVRLLIEQPDVKLNMRDHAGFTPLSRAAFGGYEGIVRLLIAQPGVELNVEDMYGLTPLSWAKRIRHEVMVNIIEQAIEDRRASQNRRVQKVEDDTTP